ncbi:MAG: hypothetical protein OIF58_10550 [Cohaesibacter sp.]|nr:hypothetical protein [Cohaesibacter sp.]
MAAIPADNKTAQGKVFIGILARWRFRPLNQAFLDSLVSLKSDQPLMTCLAERDIPFRSFKISGIKGLGQDIMDALITDFTGGETFGEVRL